MNHQVFERTWHSSEYACFSVVTPSPRREPCGGPWASWGLAASSPSLHRGEGGRKHFTHVARSVQASREPRLNPFLALRVLPARRLPLRHGATAADRGTARCGRRALKPEQGRRAIQQPPCTLAPCLVRDRSPAKRRDSSDARSWAREGGPHGPCSRPNTTPFSYSDLKSSKRTR